MIQIIKKTTGIISLLLGLYLYFSLILLLIIKHITLTNSFTYIKIQIILRLFASSNIIFSIFYIIFIKLYKKNDSTILLKKIIDFVTVISIILLSISSFFIIIKMMISIFEGGLSKIIDYSPLIIDLIILTVYVYFKKYQNIKKIILVFVHDIRNIGKYNIETIMTNIIKHNLLIILSVSYFLLICYFCVINYCLNNIYVQPQNNISNGSLFHNNRILINNKSFLTIRNINIESSASRVIYKMNSMFAQRKVNITPDPSQLTKIKAYDNHLVTLEHDLPLSGSEVKSLNLNIEVSFNFNPIPFKHIKSFTYFIHKPYDKKMNQNIYQWSY